VSELLPQIGGFDGVLPVLAAADARSPPPGSCPGVFLPDLFQLPGEPIDLRLTGPQLFLQTLDLSRALLERLRLDAELLALGPCRVQLLLASRPPA